MEIEMKYAISTTDTVDHIWNDSWLKEMEEVNTREKIYMKASYFDTEDYILSKNDIAFRIRMEGNRIVASLKWNGESTDGLHTREEINVPVNDEACFILPNPEIFKESEPGKEMLGVLQGRPLHSILETRFLRSKFRIDTGTTLCELSLDTGEIVTDFGNSPICELELELFSGDQDELLQIGKKIAEKYHLEPENRSKYVRGLKLLQDNEYLD
ncbi:MAG: CYTH domain-containing protein [Anaerovorax sp.]